MDRKKIIGIVLIISASLVWTPLGNFMDVFENYIKIPSGFSLLELFSYFVAPAFFVTGLFLFNSSANNNPRYIYIQKVVSNIMIAILLLILLMIASYGFGVTHSR